MSISLTKGQSVSLIKEAPQLTQVCFGLGWDPRRTAGVEFDLDASAFLLDARGQVMSDQHFVFYNNPRDPRGAVVYSGDNRTGEGEGDDEQIQVDLKGLEAQVVQVAFVVSIYQAEERRQNFGQVENAYIRALDVDGNRELARFDLSEDAALATAMVFGELRRRSGAWDFGAVGEPRPGGLAGVARSYGVRVG